MALQPRDAFVAGDKKEIIEEKGVDTLDTPRAIFKGKMAEQIAPLLLGFLASCNPADDRFIGSPSDYLIFKGTAKGTTQTTRLRSCCWNSR